MFVMNVNLTIWYKKHPGSMTLLHCSNLLRPVGEYTQTESPIVG